MADQRHLRHFGRGVIDFCDGDGTVSEEEGKEEKRRSWREFNPLIPEALQLH